LITLAENRARQPGNLGSAQKRPDKKLKAGCRPHINEQATTSSGRRSKMLFAAKMIEEVKNPYVHLKIEIFYFVPKPIKCSRREDRHHEAEGERNEDF
jgi:hypothetical protein